MESSTPVTRSSARPRALIVVGGVFVALLGLAALSYLLGFNPFAGPDFSDDGLVQTFSSKRAAFEELAWLTNSEPRVSGHVPPYGPGDERYGVPTGFAPSSERRYESLRREIGATDIGVSEGEVEVTMDSEGIVSSGHDKGFLYTNEPPAPLVDDFDSYLQGKLTFDGTIYRRLGKGWYAYLYVF